MYASTALGVRSRSLVAELVAEVALDHAAIIGRVSAPTWRTSRRNAGTRSPHRRTSRRLAWACSSPRRASVRIACSASSADLRVKYLPRAWTSQTRPVPASARLTPVGQAVLEVPLVTALALDELDVARRGCHQSAAFSVTTRSVVLLLVEGSGADSLPLASGLLFPLSPVPGAGRSRTPAPSDLQGQRTPGARRMQGGGTCLRAKRQEVVACSRLARRETRRRYSSQAPGNRGADAPVGLASHHCRAEGPVAQSPRRDRLVEHGGSEVFGATLRPISVACSLNLALKSKGSRSNPTPQDEDRLLILLQEASTARS